MASSADTPGRNGGEETNQKSIPTEETFLLPNADEAANGQAGKPTTLQQDQQNKQVQLQRRLMEEQDRPWPSTFERSIGLLASPILHKDEVTLFTSSPKPGFLTILQQQERRASKLDRGTYSTSEQAMLISGESGVPKVQSLDFLKQTSSNIQAVQSAQEKRMIQAQAYRQKILSEKRGNKTTKSQKQPHAKATFVQCVFNLANILMGVGLLGLPFAFKVAGWTGGAICITLFGAITWWTSILIGRQLNGDPRPLSVFDDDTALTRMLPPIHSFPDIARASFGEITCVVLSMILYFELFSCVAIFFVSMGDHLHQLMPSISTTTHMLLASLSSLLPTIVLRTPVLLSYLSMVGTLATCAVVLAVLVSAVTQGDTASQVAKREELRDPTNVTEPPYHVNWKADGLMLASGLVAYCFSGHAIIPSIYTSMERPCEYENVVTSTFLLVVMCCLAVGLSGYLMFGSTVQDQVTLSLESSSDAVYAMRALTWLMIMTAFSKVTLTMFPLALGIEETIAPYLTSERMVEYASSAIKTMLTLLALVVAVFCPSFSFLCSLVGLICTMTVSVVFPCAAHLKMFGPKLSWGQKLVNWVLIILGLVTGLVGTIASISS